MSKLARFVSEFLVIFLALTITHFIESYLGIVEYWQKILCTGLLGGILGWLFFRLLGGKCSSKSTSTSAKNGDKKSAITKT